MTDTRYQNGAFVFTRARGVEPRRPEEIEPLLARHGLNPDIAPAYPGDRAAVGRAFTAAKAGLSKEGLLLRPIKRTGQELVFGVVRETSDEVDQRLDHEFEAVIAWSAEPDPSRVHGEHAVAHRVAANYKELRGKITSDDWSGAITTYLEEHDAARVRSDGRVYWVPPQRVEAVRKLGGFLAEIGIDLILCELDPEVRTVVKGVAAENIQEQLDRLVAEVEQFDGKQRPGTYQRRLDEFQRLRNRAVLYQQALGFGADRATAVLDELQTKVEQMLELRTNIIIPRETASEADLIAAPASEFIPADQRSQNQESPSLRFAGAIFKPADKGLDGNTLRFVSDDAGAQAKVKLLESLGIAGHDCWQKLGATSVCVANNGPVGEKMSIKVQLPDGQNIADSARSLSDIGIEVLGAR